MEIMEPKDRASRGLARRHVKYRVSCLVLGDASAKSGMQEAKSSQELSTRVAHVRRGQIPSGTRKEQRYTNYVNWEMVPGTRLALSRAVVPADQSCPGC